MRVDLAVLTVMLALPPGQQRGVVSGVSVSKPTVDTGAAVEITVTGTNPCGAVRLDYGDGTDRVTHPITQLPATVKYAYKQAGRYEIRAEGMGNCDGASAAAVQVNPSRTPEPDRTPRSPEPSPPPRPPTRFREMDANNDGVITRAEWRGNPRLFREHDWNRDGILSGDELRPGSEDVVVNAAERWTDTGLHVREGEVLRIESSGTVQLSGNPSDAGGPGGVASGRRAAGAPLESRPAGALIARIGNSAPLFVGQERTFRVPATGQLYLGINDDHLADNRGHLIVRIVVER